MSATPEEYARYRGQPLGHLVIETIRTKHAEGEEVTAWKLVKWIPQLYGKAPGTRASLYNRIRTQVKSFEVAGLLTRKDGKGKQHQVYKVLIPVAPKTKQP